MVVVTIGVVVVVVLFKEAPLSQHNLLQNRRNIWEVSNWSSSSSSSSPPPQPPSSSYMFLIQFQVSFQVERLSSYPSKQRGSSPPSRGGSGYLLFWRSELANLSFSFERLSSSLRREATITLLVRERWSSLLSMGEWREVVIVPFWKERLSCHLCGNICFPRRTLPAK